MEQWSAASQMVLHAEEIELDHKGLPDAEDMHDASCILAKAASQSTIAHLCEPRCLVRQYDKIHSSVISGPTGWSTQSS